MKHADIRNLLPWHVAATLSESERVEVEGHLETCTECRQEVEELRALQSVEVELSRDTPALQSDMLQRALGEIESHEGHKPLRRRDPAGDSCTSESERESHGGGQDRCQCRGTNRNRS